MERLKSRSMIVVTSLMIISYTHTLIPIQEVSATISWIRLIMTGTLATILSSQTGEEQDSNWLVRARGTFSSLKWKFRIKIVMVRFHNGRDQDQRYILMSSLSPLENQFSLNLKSLDTDTTRGNNRCQKFWTPSSIEITLPNSPLLSYSQMKLICSFIKRSRQTGKLS